MKCTGERNDVEYPEHEKLAKIQPQSQKCGEFVDWLRDEHGIYFVKYDTECKYYFQIDVSNEDLLAQFFGIDQRKLEIEKRMMLGLLREQLNSLIQEK